MKKFFVVISLVLAAGALAGPTQKKTVLEVNFERSNKRHTYLITSSVSKKPSFTLSFQNEKKKMKSLSISERQTELIKNQATRIIWGNQYRKPASVEDCREYLSIKTDLDKTRVCYENKVATGESFWFLNSLNQMFK